MAFFEMKYHSDALKIGVSVNVILPEKAKTLIGMTANGASAPTYKTLYLFHGLSDDHSIWMRRTSIERYASDYGIAVVMPSVGRSWYTDTPSGANYLTFVTEELPRVCQSYFRGMSDKREDNMVAGLSMGGYGAIKAAMTRPDLFGCCASLSGALDIAGRPVDSRMDEWRSIFGYGLQDLSELRGTRHDLYALVEAHLAAGKEFPKLYMWCGEQDFLLQSNRDFHRFLDEKQIAHVYEESEGNHSWLYWDQHIQDALRCFLKA